MFLIIFVIAIIATIIGDEMSIKIIMIRENTSIALILLFLLKFDVIYCKLNVFLAFVMTNFSFVFFCSGMVFLVWDNTKRRCKSTLNIYQKVSPNT